MLRILLLGPPAIFFNDTPHPVIRRSLRSLLFFLAAQNTLISREEVGYFFWPEETEEKARRRLREALSKLRAQLPTPDRIIIDQDNLGIDYTKTYVDLKHFETLFRLIKTTSNNIPADKSLEEETYQNLLRAFRLWRTPNFMAGINFPPTEPLDRWYSSTSRKYEDIRLAIVQRLIDHCTATAKYTEAIHFTRIALETDILNDELHRRYINLLCTQGRKAEAQQYGRYLENLYWGELGQEIPPALRQACQDITKPSQIRQRPNRQRSPNLNSDILFSGRKQLLEELRYAYENGGAVILSGERGCGKTHLANTFLLSIESVTRILPLEVREDNLTSPYQTFIELLHTAILPKEWQAIDTTWIYKFTHLIPDLINLPYGIEAIKPITSEADQQQLYHAFHQLFLHLSLSKKVVIYIDNAEACEPSTLRVLKFLSSKGFFSEQGFLLMTTTAGNKNSSWEDFLHQLRGVTKVSSFSIPPPSAETIIDLTRMILKCTPPVGFLQRLSKKTGGSLFLVVESLYALREKVAAGGLRIDDDAPILASAQHFLQMRSRELTSTSQKVLNFAAIIGYQFSFQMLQITTGIDTEKLMQSIEELEGAYLIEARPSFFPSRYYYFRHHEIHEAVLDNLSLVHKQNLHQQIAHTLSAAWDLLVPGILTAPDIARHYEGAGESRNAFHYWLRAADNARQLFAYTEANNAFVRAERLIFITGVTSSHFSSQDIFRLYRAWSNMASDIHDLKMEERCYRAMCNIGEAMHPADPLLTGCGLRGLAGIAVASGEVENGFRYSNQAIQFLEQSNVLHEKIETYRTHGVLYSMKPEYDAASMWYSKAIALGGDSQEPRVIREIVAAEGHLARLYLMRGLPLNAVRLCQQSLGKIMLLPNPAIPFIQNQFILASARYLMGDYASCLETCRLQLDTARRIHSQRLICIAHLLTARAALSLGNLDTCWNSVQEVFKIDIDNAYSDLVREIYVVLGDIYLLLFDSSQAYQCYQKRAAFAQTTQKFVNTIDNYPTTENLYRKGLEITFNKNLDTGLLTLQRIANHTQESGFGKVRFTSESGASLMEIPRSEFDRIVEEIHQVREQANQRSLGQVPVASIILLSRMSIHKGYYAEGIQYAEEAIAGAISLRNVWLEINGYRLLVDAQRKMHYTHPHGIHEMRNLFERIRENCKTPELQSSFQCFQTQVNGFQQVP